MSLRSLLAAAFLAAALAPAAAGAATLDVPGQYATIQEALDAAADGDAVQVAAGTYLENLAVPARAIALQGAGQDVTILDGGQARSVLRVAPGGNLALAGFTLRNGTGETTGAGDATGLYLYGGGLYAAQATVNVSACRFTGNGEGTHGNGGGAMFLNASGSIADSIFDGNLGQFGGGLGFINSSFTVSRVRIEGNTAQYAGGLFTNWSSLTLRESQVVGNASTLGEGGGLAFWAYSSPSLVDVTISGNTAASHGGGAYASGYSWPSFTRCLVKDNVALGTGGGAVGWNAGLTFERSVVEGNRAGTGGGVVQYSSALTLTNSVVRSNRAEAAGGVLVNIGASMQIGHSTVTGNVTTSLAGGSGAGGVERQPKPPEYTYSVYTSMVNSLIWGNLRGGAASDVGGLAAGELLSSDVGDGTLAGTDGNFSADPLFAPGDWHLTAGSPCRDAGRDLGGAWYAAADLDGDPRALAAGGDGLPDVGADEYRPPADQLPPVTAVSLAGTPGQGGWWVSPVAVTLSAADAGGSGVASTAYSLDGQSWLGYAAPFTLAADGTTAFWVRSTDRAGNAESPRLESVAIDQTPPAIVLTAPAAGAAYVLRQPVAAAWSASDAASGLAAASGTAPSGAAVDTATVGAKTFAVTAADVAGNAAARSAAYAVRYAFGGVLPPLRANGGGTSRAGQPLLVKFQLFDWARVPVATAVARLFVAPVVGGVVGAEVPARPVSGSSGNLFRYDAASRQYQLNMSTAGMRAGVYELRIALDDGTSQRVRHTLTAR